MSRLRRVKIAGRWVDAPAWALALPFEVRPMRGFRPEGWGYWRTTLALLAKAAKARRLDVRWVRIHEHIGTRREPSHPFGWVVTETGEMFLCSYDKGTALHELAHLESGDSHGDPWARACFELHRKFLPRAAVRAADLEVTRYLSGRREWKRRFGERPPKQPVPKSAWVKR
ncbi:MAG: hypothetical protein DWI51_03015 [Chloroflexi bacterium]|jgi:hypothetical protein|nr:MAG: hypothetical protein DWI45_04245 [Chloroflexota bacterium]RLT28955.1 MAG: hypothetical protein DWI51_03015 [Chloroflexota bacterium]